MSYNDKLRTGHMTMRNFSPILAANDVSDAARRNPAMHTVAPSGKCKDCDNDLSIILNHYD